MRMNSIASTIAKKKAFFFALLFIVAVGFVVPQGATAQLIGINWTGWIDTGINAILLLVLKGFALVLSYVAFITDWAIQPSPITTSYFVQQGWVATRDFANMFFILILLAIALSFILFDSFGVKQMLPKLLLIALLINFSVPIAGILIDFANITTTFFLDQISQGTFTESVAQSVGISKVFDADTFTAAGSSLNQNNVGDNTFINTLFSIGLMIGMIFIFLALALMFLIRTGYISVLLIVLPIALVLSAFPPTKGHFGKWMHKFTQWVMFAPIAAFFLYLSMLVFTATSSVGTPEILSMGGGDTVTEDSVAFTLLRYVMAWGLMLGSLVVAQSMGITTAGAALATWKSGTKWARGKASQAGKTMAAAGGRRMKADEKMEKLAGAVQRAVPGLGGTLASGIRGVASKTKTAMEKQEALTPTEKAKLETLSDAALASEQEVYEESKLPGSGAKVAQIAAMRAKRGKLNVRGANGEIDPAETEKETRKAYAAAKQSKNKEALALIAKSNPLVFGKIKEEEFEEDLKKGDVIETFDVVTKERILRNRKTGVFLHDVKNKAMEDMTTKDFENMKGGWNKADMEGFINGGAISSSHIRMADSAGDSSFINHIQEIMNDLNGLTKTNQNEAINKLIILTRKNQGFVNSLRSGKLDQLGVQVSPDVIAAIDLAQERVRKNLGLL